MGRRINEMIMCYRGYMHYLYLDRKLTSYSRAGVTKGLVTVEQRG